MQSATRRLLAILSLSFSLYAQAQPAGEGPVKKEARPYKVYTSGKQITLKSSKNIQSLMLWTSGGHRVIEQRDINAAACSFTIPVNEKIFFLMVGMEGGRVYTEKIGVR